MYSTARGHGGQAIPAPHLAEPGQPGKGWWVKVSAEVDLAAIDAAHFKMLHVLERRARSGSSCYPGNARIAAEYGCSVPRARAILRAMEQGGLIRRVPAQDGRGARRERILLLERLNRDFATESVIEFDHEPEPAPAVDAGSGDRIRSGDVIASDRGGCSDPITVMKTHSNQDEDDDEPSSVSDDPEVRTLEAKATARLGCPIGVARVRAALRRYTAEELAAVLFGCPNKLWVWGGVLKTLKNWRAEGIPPSAMRAGLAGLRRPTLDAERAARTARERSAALDAAAAEADRNRRLEAAWAALSDAERATVEAGVAAANPAFGRWPALLKGLCLEAIAGRFG